jgi:metallo-beta-lactamase family protein
VDITAATSSHPLGRCEVTLLGAAESVTGAMTLVAGHGGRILVDCGVAQGDEARTWRFPDALADVTAVVLTHGHNDHVGSLPTLLESGFRGPIFGTAATLDIADLVLSDGLRLARVPDPDIAGFRRRFRDQARAVEYGETFRAGGADFDLRLAEAGHILGSASVELVGPGARIIVSGDLGRPGTPLLRDYHRAFPPGQPVDLVVLESTYGDREHTDRPDQIADRLETIVRRALADGGHILVPAFAIGRTQTLLYHLNALVEAGRLPDVTVAVDSPLGLRVTELHARARRLYDGEARARLARGDDPLSFQGLYAVNRAADSERLRGVGEPVLIIAGSGMCTGGRIVGHLKELLPDPRTCVLFVGYQARGTPGRAIIEAAKDGGSVRLEEVTVPVRAQVEVLSGLSAHADRRELAEWLFAIPEVARVALHHGEVEVQRRFAEWLARGGQGRPA